MSADIPRVVWQAKHNSLRVVVTDTGPARSMISAGALPLGLYYILELRESNDALGGKRWRMVDPHGDQGVWREAFHLLAQEAGLFSEIAASEMVRELLRSTEEL